MGSIAISEDQLELRNETEIKDAKNRRRAEAKPVELQPTLTTNGNQQGDLSIESTSSCSGSSDPDSPSVSPPPDEVSQVRVKPCTPVPDPGAPNNKCPICNSIGNKLCSKCHSVYYCSVDHQKKDWKHHKAHCCPYVVKESHELGRHLVAARSLKPGTVIYQELPVAYAPRIDDGTQEYLNEDQNEAPICLSCCKKMLGKESSTCSKCKWPICSSACAQAKAHSDFECNYFKQNKIKYSKHALSSSKKLISSGLLYRGILILRTILKKESLQQTKVWDELMKLQSERADGCNTHAFDKDTLIFFKSFFKLNSMKLSDFEEWNKLNGIIEVNSYSIDRAEKEHEEPSQVQLLMLKSGLLSHSCVPNCSWGVAYSPNFSMKVRAAKQINKGEVISVSYNRSWNYFGTHRRKDMILKTAGFLCCCERCSDSNLTEMDTYMSAMKCREPLCSGYLLQHRGTKPCMWKCENQDCGSEMSDQNVVDEIKLIEDELCNIQNILASLPSPLMGLGILDDFISRFSCTLHSNHWILQRITRFMIEVQGAQLLRLDLKDLSAFIQQCNYLLRIYDVLAPGISLDRALLQMYLSRAMYLLYCETYKKNGASTSKVFIVEDPQDKQEILIKVRELQEDAWLYWKDDIQTKPLDEDIGFEAQLLESDMIAVLIEISNL